MGSRRRKRTTTQITRKNEEPERASALEENVQPIKRWGAPSCSRVKGRAGQRLDCLYRWQWLCPPAARRLVRRVGRSSRLTARLDAEHGPATPDGSLTQTFGSALAFSQRVLDTMSED